MHKVVALGLSGGFLEPLESTSICLVQRAMGKFIDLPLPGAPFTEQARADYNGDMARQFARARFPHPALLPERTPRQRAVARDGHHGAARPLAFKLHAWRQAGALHQHDQEGFDATSWLAIHAGMGHWPEHTDPSLADMARAEALEGLQWRRERIATAVAGMPKHDAYLRGKLGR